MPRDPGNTPDVVAQRVRLRYAKRGRLRFTSHRDFARAFERALRRAGVPMAYSAGFTPHPKVSYLGASPTGVASEAEYVEIALVSEVDPERLRAALDEALPAGLDVLEAVPAVAAGLAERIDASLWRFEFPGVDASHLDEALANFFAAGTVPLVRLTKGGRRSIDPRAAVVAAEVVGTEGAAGASGPTALEPCAIMDAVVRHVTPAVRPDDVLTGLRTVADLVTPVPPRATRLAQGALTLTEGATSASSRVSLRECRIIDPLAADRAGSVTGSPDATA